MTDSISIIRRAGFFTQFQNLNNEELIDKLYELKKIKYSKMFGDDYSPERREDLYSIVSQDAQKFLDIDLEADVCADNKVYIEVLNYFANASNGKFTPTNISEVWESEEGPIKVVFDSNGQQITFEPEYIDDWIDGRIFGIIQTEIKKVSEENFHMCAGPNDDWFGQNLIYIRLTTDEKQVLKDKLSWNFPEE